MRSINRGLALVYAVGLGVGEAVLNWGNWQYAPLWIVDYIIVIWLLVGVFSKKRSALILFGGWSFALAVMYMALAVVTDPANAAVMEAPGLLLALMGLLAGAAFFGGDSFVPGAGSKLAGVGD